MGELQKTLGYKSILLITINSIMGTGIFFLPALGAKVAGPASLISWAIMAVIAIYTSICFAELTSMYPKSGGLYEFAKQAFGRTTSFFIGWTTLIAGYITIAMLIIGAIQYIFPNGQTWIIILLCSLFVIAFNVITYTGMKTSATMLIAFAFITLGTLFGLIIPALFDMNFSNIRPFFGDLGFSASIPLILIATFKVAETFFGWETATFLAGETKDGARVVSKALVHGTIIIAFVVLLFVFTALTSIPSDVFGQSLTPLSDLAHVHYGGAAVNLFSILIYLSIIGSVAGWIVSAPRLILSLSEDDLFIKQLSHISPKFNTPSYAIIFQTVVIIIFLFAGAGSYEALLHLLVPMLLFLYSFVMATVVILRYKHPHVRRYVKTPFGKVGPIVMIVLYLALVGMWIFTEHDAANLLLLGLSFIVIGLPMYVLIRLLNDAEFAGKAKDMTAYYNLFFESLFIPEKVKKEIFASIGDVHGKTVLEYGSSIGTLTRQLLEDVGPKGHVISINNSFVELSILERRVKQHKRTIEQLIGDLDIIHHMDYHHTVHQSIPLVDAVVSLDTLNTIQDPESLLKQLSKVVQDEGHVCFFDFTNFFSILPDQSWLSNDQAIRDTFRKAGFVVNIRREKGLYWKYVFIYGVKTSKTMQLI